MTATAKTSAAKVGKTRRQEERRQSQRIRQADRVAKQRDKVFPEPGRHRRLHPRAIRAKVGTREIAREFGLKNADRVELKRILRELADQGTIAKRGKKIHEPAALPPTVMADITGRDSDGELIATPDRMG